MKNIKKSWILLIGILVIASVLRLYQIGSVPPSPDWDEAALGYNAYSVMTTGRDEYGKFMPIVLQSFDDYKPALYAYSIIPFIPLFGVDIISVRLPSALFGILTVLATYFLVHELFKRKSIALIVTFLLAISPWHIQFSRVAFEANTGLAFNIFAALFFVKGLKKPWLLVLSALFMGLNLSIYQSDKIFTPLLAMSLVLIYWKQLFVVPKKYLITAFLVGLIVVLPLLSYLVTNKQALARAQGVSLFSDPVTLLLESHRKLADDKNNGNIIGVLFHNRRIIFGQEMILAYISHYDFKWLFVEGDLKRHHAPEISQLYLWELPFLLIGIYALLFFKFPTKTKILIFTWFLIAPIPASFTTGVPHAVRTLNFLPTFQIFVAIGLIAVYQFSIKYKRSSKTFAIVHLPLAFIYLLFAVFNFMYYLNQYFVQQNYFASHDWQYGYKEVVAYVKSVEHKYDKIVVSDAVSMEQSYMFFLFYLQYSPAAYQQEGNTTAGFREAHKFSKYEFRPINWDNEEKNPKILYVGRAIDFSGGSVLKTINYLNDRQAIKIVEGKKNKKNE
jgi:4-amino-4-deoxy-L-arabinose transferase-like glycosyltransferase